MSRHITPSLQEELTPATQEEIDEKLKELAAEQDKCRQKRTKDAELFRDNVTRRNSDLPKSKSL